MIFSWQLAIGNEEVVLGVRKLANNICVFICEKLVRPLADLRETKKST